MKNVMKNLFSAITMLWVLFIADPLNGAETATSLQVTLKNNTGDVMGEITLEQTVNGVLLTGVLHNVPPGAHAFHVHEKGECDPTTDFESAGGHLANGSQHGFRTPGGPHPGDMPNLRTSSDATEVEIFNSSISLQGENSLLDEDGAALVLHAGVDDYRSQPSGNAGARLACGVIGEKTVRAAEE